jgi:hypothetical protein
MTAIDRVECRGCGRAVVPQLMVDGRNKLYRPVVTHLCPFCGAVLHVSGGRLDRGVLALVVGVCLFCLICFVLLLARL